MGRVDPAAGDLEISGIRELAVIAGVGTREVALFFLRQATK